MTAPTPMSGAEAFAFFSEHDRDWDILAAEISRRAVEVERIKVARLRGALLNLYAGHLVKPGIGETILRDALAETAPKP